MAEENDTSQEKTEQPTPKKLRQAKQQGQVPRSRELNSMSVMIVGAAGMLLLGGYMIGHLGQMLENGFTLTREQVMDPQQIFLQWRDALAGSFMAIGPFLALMTVVALAAPLLIGGWAFSAEQMSFKPSRLNPLSGLKRIFSLKGLVELVKALAKFAVVTLVALLFMNLNAERFLALGQESFLSGLTHAAWLFGYAFLFISAALILIAVIDVPFQIYDHNQKLKMTLQEVRDELKETEGRPEVKSKVRALQQEMAQRRMMEQVPQADVIITNPTHYAVALQYDPDNMAVPVVVAMGKDLIALKIREIATFHEIEIFEAPPLARALFAQSRIGEEIPSRLYYAVAQVLAFIFQLRRAREFGLEQPPRPDVYLPTDEQA